MKITKKELQELVNKDGALIGRKSSSPKYGGALIGSYDTTDDHVTKVGQDKSVNAPYRRYFGEDDMSSHPLFDISKKAKTYVQFVDISKKEHPKMGTEAIEKAATEFGYKPQVSKKLDEGMAFYDKDKHWFSSSKMVSNQEVIKHKNRFGDDVTFSVDGYQGKFDTWEEFTDYIKSNEDKIPTPYTLPKSKEKFDNIDRKPIGSILRFSDGITVDTSGELRPLELVDGWYVVGHGYLTPTKSKQDSLDLIEKMKGNLIEGKKSAKELLEKIVKIKDEGDIIKRSKKERSDNRRLKQAFEELISFQTTLNKYRNIDEVDSVLEIITKSTKKLKKVLDKMESSTISDNLTEGYIKQDGYTLSDIEKTIKLSQIMVYSDLGQTEKDFKYSPNEIIDMINDGADEEPTHLMSFEDEIKRKLKLFFKGTDYDKTGIIDQLIDQLLTMRKKWLETAKKTMSSQDVADKLFTYNKNLRK